MLTLSERNQPADFLTLCDLLEQRDQLENVGNASYLASLINGVPTSGNLEYYARIVVQKAGFRRLIHAAGQIAALAYEEIEDAQERAEQLLFAFIIDYSSGCTDDSSPTNSWAVSHELARRYTQVPSVHSYL